MQMSKVQMQMSKVQMQMSKVQMQMSKVQMQMSKVQMSKIKSSIACKHANIKSSNAKIKSSANIKSSNANVKSHGADKRKKRIKFRRSIVKEIYQNADMYLHYSNYIVIYASNSLPVINIILVKLTGTGVTGKMILIIFSAGDPVIFYLNFNEAIDSFDGVIERYCGVPP
jgi:hypothetical protein